MAPATSDSRLDLIALDRVPMRGYLEDPALVDGIDAAAPDRCDHIRPTTLPGAAGLAAAGALLSAWLARQLDPAPPPQPGQRRGR